MDISTVCRRVLLFKWTETVKCLWRRTSTVCFTSSCGGMTPTRPAWKLLSMLSMFSRWRQGNEVVFPPLWWRLNYMVLFLYFPYSCFNCVPPVCLARCLPCIAFLGNGMCGDSYDDDDGEEEAWDGEDFFFFYRIRDNISVIVKIVLKGNIMIVTMSGSAHDRKFINIVGCSEWP